MLHTTLHLRNAHLLVLLGVSLLNINALPRATAATGKLTVRVHDADNGKLLPARLAIQVADGTWPGDRLNVRQKNWPHLEAHAVFISGEQTLELAAGEVSIAAAHGFEYQCAKQRIQIREGETSVLELKLKRICNLRQLGWVAGDMHVHMMHGENERQTSYEEVAQVCAANGLDFVFVGQEYVGAGQLDLAGYHEACRKVSNDSFQMFLGGECPKSLLGHQTLIGVSNPFVIAEDPPYFLSARKIHEQGGVSIYVHPVRYYPERQYQGAWLDFPESSFQYGERAD